MKVSDFGPGSLRITQYVVAFLSYLSSKGSFPKMRSNNAVGVTTKKNSTPSVIGLIMICKSSPNLAQRRLNGTRIAGIRIEIAPRRKLITIAQGRTCSP